MAFLRACFCKCRMSTDDEMKADASSICSEDPEQDRKAVWVQMPDIDKSKNWALFSKKKKLTPVTLPVKRECTERLYLFFFLCRLHP